MWPLPKYRSNTCPSDRGWKMKKNKNIHRDTITHPNSENYNNLQPPCKESLEAVSSCPPHSLATRCSYTHETKASWGHICISAGEKDTCLCKNQLVFTDLSLILDPNICHIYGLHTTLLWVTWSSELPGNHRRHAANFQQGQRKINTPETGQSISAHLPQACHEKRQLVWVLLLGFIRS